MTPLERLLAEAEPRCAHWWAHEQRGTHGLYLWHTCTRVPGHEGTHRCPCGALDSRRAA
jgi:hypothetical protein